MSDMATMNECERLSDECQRLREQLYAANRRRQSETKKAVRRRDELRVLRERLAEYERPVDDKELAELISYVNTDHPTPWDPNSGVKAVEVAPGSIGMVVKYDPTEGPPMVEYVVGDVRVIAEWRPGDGEVLP